MTISLRRASATDASFLAWAMLAAARSHLQIGHWDVSIGGSDEQLLTFLKRLAVTGNPHFCHYSTFAVAEVNGHVAAGLCGYDPQLAGIEPLVAALFETFRALGRTDAERDASFERSRAFLSCAPDNAEGAWIVENVATLPEHRGRGLINRLLHRVLDEGRERGFRRAQIGVLIGNTPAQRAYEGVGFQVLDEKRTPEFEAVFGSPGIRRLLQDFR